MITMLFAAQLAAVQPAGDTVEIEIVAEGSAEAQAEGYQVTAMFQPGNRKAIEELSKLEAPERETCVPGQKFGFVGNEAFLEEGDEAPGPAVEAGAEEADGGFQPPTFYSGIFASRETAEQALKLFRTRNAVMRGGTPILYECEDVMERAKLDALAHSGKNAALMAEALGMRVAGVTRISDENNHTDLAFAMASLYSSRDFDRDTVKVTRTLKVVYLLRK